MVKTRIMLSSMLPALAIAQAASSQTLGVAEGRCRPSERGPSLIISVVGLKDRKGNLKAELYPYNDRDYLADDTDLVKAGKTFRRVVIALPQEGTVQMCIRAPAAGTYALTVLHDRDRDGRFNRSRTDGDGLGFGRNPTSQGPFKPAVENARVAVGNGPTPATIRMMYRTGLFTITPLKTH